MDSHAIQYTVRGVPLEVDRSLRERARIRKVSINQVIVEELTKATIGSVPQANFMDLVGVWQADEAFDRALKSQREVHEEDWR